MTRNHQNILTVDELTKKAHAEYPGEHVFYKDKEIVAHGVDPLKAMEEYWGNNPDAKGDIVIQVRPKGEPERKYVSRPRGGRG